MCTAAFIIINIHYTSTVVVIISRNYYYIISAIATGIYLLIILYV